MALLQTRQYSAYFIVMLLAGCNGIVPSATNTSATSSLSTPTHSWMNPDSKRRDLLYVTVSSAGQIWVFSYPGGKLEGILTSAFGPESDCVDKTGNVWVPDASRVALLEYAHGGTNPIRVLQNPAAPYDCSVDPTTGDLAVMNVQTVDIFQKAHGKPKEFYDAGMPSVYWGAYDDKGNLFVDGIDAGTGYFQFAELPKGSSTFINLSLPTIQVPGGVQWDGKYIDVADQGRGSNTVYQISVTASGAKIVGSTVLNGADAPWYQFCFPSVDNGKIHTQAAKIIATDWGEGYAQWNYPAGGDPTRIVAGDHYPTGVAISRARK